MCDELVAQQNAVQTVRINNFRNREGHRDVHHGICSELYGYWLIVNYMIGSIGSDRKVRRYGWYVLGVCIGGVCVLYVIGLYR